MTAASKARSLRTVKPGDKPRQVKPPSLVEAVELGDYKQILMAQRREIATSIPDESGPAKAALHRQLSLISKELESIDERDKEEGADLDRAADDEWSAI